MGSLHLLTTADLARGSLPVQPPQLALPRIEHASEADDIGEIIVEVLEGEGWAYEGGVLSYGLKAADLSDREVKIWPSQIVNGLIGSKSRTPLGEAKRKLVLAVLAFNPDSLDYPPSEDDVKQIGGEFQRVVEAAADLGEAIAGEIDATLRDGDFIKGDVATSVRNLFKDTVLDTLEAMGELTRRRHAE